MPGLVISAEIPPRALAGQIAEHEALRLGLGAGIGAVIPDDNRSAALCQCGGGGAARKAKAQNGDGLVLNALNGNHLRPFLSDAGALRPGPPEDISTWKMWEGEGALSGRPISGS
ncbi:hypothetical protein QWZ10_01515 [Paracoccus cavernae]|uniref:Uncharacterized protein n=1 Tax=Paracoccus cavernae TaxID=1571207 RepID=A0ABT8D3D6_9RHOB|nr:hypothetical protein [Paracoccus cavernae]